MNKTAIRGALGGAILFVAVLAAAKVFMFFSTASKLAGGTARLWCICSALV